MSSFTGASQNGWYLKLDYSYTQSTSANTSTITTTLSIYDGTGYSQNEDANSAYYLIQGEKRWNPYNYSGTGWRTLGSKTWTVNHNADGTASVTLTGEWDCGFTSSYTPRHLTVSGTLTLPTIPRATTPTIGAVTLGSAVTIGLPRASNDFTHTLTYKFGSASGTIATGAGASCTWTPPLSLASQIPSAVSGTGTITCTTYNGGTVIGTKTISFTASVPASVVPTISSCTVSPVNTNTWINGKGIYVRGYTKARLQTSAAGAYGSTIQSVAITLDGRSYTGADITSELLQTTGSLTASITVTDTRGRTASATQTITVQPYASPEISSLTYQRGTYSGGVWTANDSGEDIKVTFTMGLSLTAYSNAGAITASCTGEDNQTTSGAGAGAKTYYFTTIGVDNTRTTTISVTDSVGVTASKSTTVATVEVPLNIDAPNNRIAIGGVAEKNKTLQVKWPAEFTDIAQFTGEVKFGGTTLVAWLVEFGCPYNINYEKISNGTVKCWLHNVTTYTGSTASSLMGGYYSYVDVELPVSSAIGWTGVASGRLGTGAGWAIVQGLNATTVRVGILGNQNSNRISLYGLSVFGAWST